MATVSLTLDEIFDLAKKTLLANGCDDETASILADLIMKAERDGSLSHGLFRLPAYVSGLKSGKINGKARPEIKKISPSVIKVLGNNCLAPMVLNKGIPELVKAAKENGVAVLAITNSHHMAAMWPETESISEAGLVGFACTSYMPMVAPAGAKKALFGTNPISFSWPRKRYWISSKQRFCCPSWRYCWLIRCACKSNKALLCNSFSFRPHGSHMM